MEVQTARSLAGTYQAFPSRGYGASAVGDTHALAVFVCALGLFLRIVLSGPVLNMLGVDYGGDDSSVFGRVHPSSYLIFASFLILLSDKGNPLEQLIRIASEQTAFFAFLAINLLVIFYWVMRGPKGVGIILDVHLVAPMAAIVFSYAPRAACRRIVYGFVALAALNSAVGLAEAATHLRLFPFDPEWEVLKQDYFRSSAFLGHPLANAIFTVMAMFALLDLRLPLVMKSSGFLIMLLSLVSFGSRSALLLCLGGLAVLGLWEIKKYVARRRLSVMQLIAGAGAILIVPAICLALLWGVLHSGVGERLAAYHNFSDESADVRLTAFDAFKYMSATDLIFGDDGDQALALAERMGLGNPTTDIENPWILMFVFLGAIMFAVWLCGLAGYVWRLMEGASPALKIAVINYFAISTTSNSFGRKDLVYMMLACVVVCAKRGFILRGGPRISESKRS